MRSERRKPYVGFLVNLLMLTNIFFHFHSIILGFASGISQELSSWNDILYSRFLYQVIVEHSGSWSSDKIISPERVFLHLVTLKLLCHFSAHIHIFLQFIPNQLGILIPGIAECHLQTWQFPRHCLPDHLYECWLRYHAACSPSQPCPRCTMSDLAT